MTKRDSVDGSKLLTIRFESEDAGGLPFDHGEFEIVVEPIPRPERVRDRIFVNG